MGPEMGNSQYRGKKREDRARERPKLPASTPPARVRVRGGLGCFYLRLGKEKQDREAGGLWAGRRGTQQHGAGPSSHLAGTQSASLPQGLGP